MNSNNQSNSDVTVCKRKLTTILYARDSNGDYLNLKS